MSQPTKRNTHGGWPWSNSRHSQIRLGYIYFALREFHIHQSLIRVCTNFTDIILTCVAMGIYNNLRLCNSRVITHGIDR